MVTCPQCSNAFTEGIPCCPHCGAEAPAEAAGGSAEARDPLIGRVLANKFRVLSVLGDGGMGRVYKAEQVPLAVEVVIKTLHSHLARESEVVKRFFREAQSASRLRHPNCIAILDFGESEGTIYMAMEYLRGKNLGELLDETGAMPPTRVLRIMSQVLDVVEAAHRMSIVHRDLKPENIMVEDLATQRDFVKVLDFGIAKIIDPLGARLTQTGMIIGTPAYMSPEQARGEDIDSRTDIYSIGVICFELLSGRLPFEASSSAAYLAAHVAEPPPPIRSLCPDLSPALAAVVDSALAKEADQRPQTALDLKEALLEAAAAQAAPAPRAPAAAARTNMLPPTEPPAPGPIPGAPPPPATEQPAGISHALCPRCGFQLSPTAKFCPECGATTGRQTRSTSLGDKFADLRRFLPSGLVDEISEVTAQGPSEKRELVALILDLSGPALHGQEPEQATQVLDELYEGLEEIALRHGAHLERRPDKSCAFVFGLEISHADEAERAVSAALDIRSLAGALNEKHFRRLDVTAAIHVGPAKVQATPSGPQYTPVGDTIELPTRLAAASYAGTIVVSDPIRELVQRTVKMRRLAAVRLKGRSAAVAAYEVLEAIATASRGEGQLATPPLVGREPQLQAVLRLFDDARASGTVHVVGEPGSGKTHFVTALAEQVSSRHAISIVAQARPAPDGKSRIAGAIVGTIGGTPAAVRALGVTTAETRVLADYYAESTGSTPRLDDQKLRLAISSVLRGALENLAARRQVALLVDDVHLADPIGAELVRRLVTEPVPGLILVAASRSGYDVPWATDRTSLSVLLCAMTALTPDAMAELVRGALAPTPAPGELIDAVTSRAAGSPLTALEIMRAMIDAGALTQIGGRWTVTGDLAAFPRPKGMRALYAARIDALTDYARDVLACAAVLGDEVDKGVLEAVVGDARGSSVDRDLELLVTRGLLSVVEPPDRLRFTERSAREIIYERLPDRSRVIIHGAVATALEQRAGAGATPPEVIGEHFLAGKDLDKALEWLDRAARLAITARELERAERVLREMRDAARAGISGPSAAACNRRLAEDSLRLGEVLIDKGDLGDVNQVLTEGLVCAQKDDDPALIARVKRTRGRASLARGDVDAASRDLEQANQAAIGLRDRLLMAELNGDLGELYEKRGNLDYAARYLVRALELAQGGSSSEVQTTALRVLTALGRVSLRNRDADKAERFLQQALSLAEELSDSTAAAKVLGNLAGVHHARRDYRTSMKFAERALQLARESSDHLSIARQQNNLGTLSTLVGDTLGAQKHFAAAIKTAKRAGWREGMAAAAAGLERLKQAPR